jgi:tripartite-type tricarboxylate transporter receptor subunit TctC
MSFDLDKVVPPDHLVRQIDAVLDLSWVHEELASNPGKLSYGSAGAGTLTNLAGELFKQLIGAPDIVHIPYHGSAPGLTDLASGQIPMMTPNIGAPLLDLHRAGKVRILAIAACA